MTTMLRTTAIVSILAVSGLALATTFAQDGPPPGEPARTAGPGGPDGSVAPAAPVVPWEARWACLASSAPLFAPWS